MELYNNKDECCGCSACVDICPVNAVHLARDKEGFLYPRLEQSLCIDCKKCERVCPVKNEAKAEQENLYFGVQVKDETVRNTSSSGGMFSVLADYVLQRQGVVYGAAYNQKMNVMHREAHNKAELETIKKTKYVQSNLKGVYRRIQAQLEKGCWVLFCGTPCQAHALKLYLNKPYDKLVTVALVCYGVPSPGIWSSYVKYLERKHHGRMTDFSFRDKRNRDNGHVCSYMIGGSEYAENLNSNIYCRMYFANDSVRPSCYNCKFCSVERESDFTIGDFWGIENVKPELDDGMGTSVVIVHTGRGRMIWDCVKENVSWFECEKKDVLQPRLLSPVDPAKNRKLFMAFYKMLPFSLLVALFANVSFASAILKGIRR